MKVPLLKSLATAINKVNGNSLMIEEDVSYDEYFCTKGDHRVYEHEYNHKHQCCFKHFYQEDSI